MITVSDTPQSKALTFICVVDVYVSVAGHSITKYPVYDGQTTATSELGAAQTRDRQES